MPNESTTHAASRSDATAGGNTVPAQGERQQAVPRLPHERDESADSQPQQQTSESQKGKAAAADLERGVVDTSKAVETDATYDKLREGLADGEKKFRP